MLPMLMSLMCMNVADASRRSDTIRLLNLEKRYEEAQSKCVKWGALEPAVDPELRGFCAQAHWINAETLNSIEGWQAFQEQWAGTDWAQNAFVREGKVALQSLGDNAPEAAYLSIADQFFGYDVADDATVLAGKAAIRDAQVQEDAERIRSEYPKHPDLIQLIERYPGAFYALSLHEDGTIIVDGQYETNLKISEPFWGYRTGQGEVVPWTEAIRKHLNDSGIPSVHIMQAIQESQQSKQPLSMCPVDFDDTEGQLGLALTVGLTAVFEPQPWDEDCSTKGTSVMVYSNRSLLHVSMGSGADISLGLKRGRANFTSFVRKTGEPILFEQNIYVPVNKSFAIYPVSGATPWLTDKPPGAMQTQMDNTLRGSGLPPEWKLQGASEGIRISYPDIAESDEWILPRGEMRFLSPLMRELLDIKDISFEESTPPDILWQVDAEGVSSVPESLLSVDFRKLTEEQIKALRYHIGGAGFDPYNLKVVDGYALDLDQDGRDEKLLRAQYKESEVVLVLDVDDQHGNRTWIFGTNHAIHGKMAPPTPMTAVVGDQRMIAWSGIEDGQPYLEIVYSDAGSFNIVE